MNRYVFSILACVLCAFVSACDSGGSGQTVHETEATPLPPIKVDLPPPPPFTPVNIPEKYPDGSYSIYGLRKNIDKYTGQQVTVTAYVREVYKCPECPKGQECKACQQPHFWLTDEKDGKMEKAMMVVDYPTKKPLVDKPPEFTVGAKYKVKGTFQRASITGFNASDGLIVHEETRDEQGNLIVEGNVNVAFDVKGTAPGKGDKMRAKVEGTYKPEKLSPKKKGK